MSSKLKAKGSKLKKVKANDFKAQSEKRFALSLDLSAFSFDL